MKRSILPLFFLFSTSLYSQGDYIQDLRLDPVSPSVSDIVSVVCTARFSSSPCPMINSWVEINGSTITVHAENHSGMLTAICHNIDTVEIGRLAPGTYHLEYFKADTTRPGEWDLETIDFTVASPTNLIHMDPLPSYRIFPNPVEKGNIITLEGVRSGEEIRLFNTSGQEVEVNIAAFRNQQLSINTHQLSTGLYFFRITSQGQRTSFGRFVITD